MIQLSSKYDDSSLCYDVIIMHQNFKMSVDRPIVQLQEVTRWNMKCKYRNASGNTHFRAF